MENGYEYMMDHGVSLDNAYPYLARDDICRNSNTPRARVRVVGFRLVEQDNEEALKYAVGKDVVVHKTQFMFSTILFFSYVWTSGCRNNI